MDNSAHIINQLTEGVRRRKFHHEFETVDRRVIARMSDKELAIWQTAFPPESPQWRLAEHEWQSRLMLDQNKATFHAARLGIWGTVIGAAIGVIGTLIAVALTFLLQSHYK